MLTSIEIRGFKSFAGRTRLDFGPGINVVVGPNGSGKSNLAEAVAWAFGEQRASRLRAPAMADVLYGGGTSTPPAGVAEVTVSIGDGDGAAILEATRRLTRAGETEYRLNGCDCRLLDLQDELAGRGLGPDSLAIIRQGQVEAICMSRPGDRRAMLDDAAGVGVSKRRRHRAELKLARVADRLDRARDIAGEIASRGRALERQARAAARAADVQRDLEGARASLRDALAARAHHEAALARSAHARLDTARRRAAAELASARAAAEACERGRDEAVRATEVLVDEASTLREAGERVATHAQIARERLAAFGDRAASRQRERDRARQDLHAIAQELAILDPALAGARAESAEAERAHLELERELGDATRDLANAEAELARLGAARASWRQAMDAEIVTEASVAAELARHADMVAGAEAPEDVTARLTRTDRRVELASARLMRRRADGDAAARRREDARARVLGVEARIRAAQEDARRHATDDEAESSGRSLGADIHVLRGYERAVAAALGPASDAVIALDRGEAVSALAAGAPAAVVVSSPRARSAAPTRALHLLDVVSSPDPVTQAHLERLLSDAWIVGDLADVPDGAPGSWVTTAGAAFRPDSGLMIGARGAWLGRVLHAAACADIDRLERELESATGDRAAAEEGAMRAERRQRAADDGAARMAVRRGQVAAELAEATRRWEAWASADRDLALRRDAAMLRLVGVRAAEPAEEALEAQRRHVRASRERIQDLTDRARDARTRAAERRALVSTSEARRVGLATREERARAVVGAHHDGSLNADALERAIAVLTTASAAVARAAAATRDAASSGRARVTALDGARAGAAAAVDAADTRVGTTTDLAQAAAIALAVAEDRAREAGPLPADGADASALDIEALTGAVATAERRRDALGAVNPLAAQERDALAEREREINEQVGDLERASAALRTHLAELDAAVTEGFDRTFTLVAERFRDVVSVLFPGGSGRLEVVSGESEADCGIEVEVTPAGKRARPLSLLSGGERTLVALAFLLALAMARPAPAYVLDEVEAALDDVNLRRLLGLVRRLAAETQFLMITHQQPTVEIADTLFGVTMGRGGVTQVVSRRLARSVEGPAKPYVRRRLAAVEERRSA